MDIGWFIPVGNACVPYLLEYFFSVLWRYNSRTSVILKNLEAFRRGEEGMSDKGRNARARVGFEHLQERVPSAGWPCQAGTLITPSRDGVTEAPGILANSPNLSQPVNGRGRFRLGMLAGG